MTDQTAARPARTGTSFATGDRRATKRGDRRTHARLRELCDEVIASHRVASGREPISDADRAEANAVLGSVAPIGR